MSIEFSRDLFVLIFVGLSGGILAKVLRFHSLVGFIVAGVVLKVLFPQNSFGANEIAQLGLIFLLFTTGLELSIDKLTRVARVALIGAVVQIILVTLACFLALRFFAIDQITALVLSLGFSLSSTAVVIKMLLDKGEAETIHGQVTIGWLLIQDLAVVLILMFVNLLGQGAAIELSTVLLGLSKALGVVALTILVGKLFAPKFLHLVASLNSREILLLASLFMALGTALATSYFGISPALGAFLAGVVISGSIEKHAIFAEVRPLRDLFVGIFFVSLGLLITPAYVISNLGLIVLLTVLVILVKFVVNMLVTILLGYHGKTAVSISVNLSQIGEFSFILLLLARNLSLISDKALTTGVSAALLSLIVFPALQRQIVPLWRLFKRAFSHSEVLSKFFLGWDKKALSTGQVFRDHIVICGYGRVGGWVGKALTSMKMPFVVVEYNQRVVDEMKDEGTPVIYGDPTEKEVLEAASIRDAKVIIIAIPERDVQESIIALCQTLAPEVKIITRVHLDEEWERMKTLKVDKIIQPEFEAAIAIIRSILVSTGRSKEEISVRIKGLRQSRALSK